MWNDSDLSEEDKATLICVIPKPGADHSVAAGYRPISLMGLVTRILTGILYAKLKTAADGCLSEEQAGFRPYRRTTDQILALKQEFQIFCAVDLERGEGAPSDGDVFDYKALYKTHKVNRF